jgi:aminomethyltransferase
VSSAWPGTDFIGAASEGPTPTPACSSDSSPPASGRRADYEIFRSPDATEAEGVITSGALSPTLGYPIAMAYVAPALAQLGTEVFVDVRGSRIPATVTKLPFYKRQK